MGASCPPAADRPSPCTRPVRCSRPSCRRSKPSPAGYNVVSTCEELSWPYAHADAAQRIDAIARTAGVSVLGAGINPGFLMDVLPLTLSAACVRVDRVFVRRVVDTNQRRVPLQQKVGVGMTVDVFRERAAAGLLGHVGLRQSAMLLATGLGWTLDEYRETLEPAIAERATDTPLGAVPAGSAIGQRQLAVGARGGSEVIRLDLEMLAGANPVDVIQIEGEPPLRSVVEGGINGDIGTEAMVTNLIPTVAAARPGLLTMRDVAPLACAAHS